jgi:hypothetical protein
LCQDLSPVLFGFHKATALQGVLSKSNATIRFILDPGRFDDDPLDFGVLLEVSEGAD